MAEIYLSETNYEALFDETIDANSYPTTTNYNAVENYFANWLHAKLGITTALTEDPELHLARLWVGYAIAEFSQFNKGRQNYTSPATFIQMPVFISRMEQYNALLNDIENMLDSEREPAYYYEFDYHGGGANL